MALRLDHPYHVFDEVHLVAQGDGCDLDPSFTCFRVDRDIVYVPFHDDFGPMNIGTLYKFCDILDDQIAQSGENIALITSADSESWTNAVFLLGSYLIMKRGADLPDILEATDELREYTLSYRDVSPGPQVFELYLEDCWKGLIRARDLGWVCFDEGCFDLEEYEHLDCPINADLHEIVPGKLIAFRGPKNLPDGVQWQDQNLGGVFSSRDFSPLHYAEILLQFNVQAVVQLNEPVYDQQAFLDRGIAVADLFFDDCTDPPVPVVAKFLAMAESLPGTLAVHCRAGLGRTGTLIGLYLMRHHGFSAREAMGWLRIVRPGSVIGSQQAFLCAREPTMRAARHPICPAAAVTLPRDAGVCAVCALLDEVCAYVDRRYERAVARTSLEEEEVGCEKRREAASCERLARHVASATMRRSSRRFLTANLE